jgi:hypothetical protein
MRVEGVFFRSPGAASGIYSIAPPPISRQKLRTEKKFKNSPHFFHPAAPPNPLFSLKAAISWNIPAQ